MGIWKFLRSRSKTNVPAKIEAHELARPLGPDRLTSLPDHILATILHHVSPYTMDESCETPEQSMIPNCCGLCGLKDLHSCALVSRKTYMVIQHVLYVSIRIDAVHFCFREYELAQARARRRIEPSSIVPTRLRLLQRLAKLRPDIASDVRYLKLPYMTREALPNELTRLVASFPNLHYIDLPAAFFAADASLSLLREELANMCPQLRRTKYSEGAEYAFQSIIRNPCWPQLETLDLEGLQVDITSLRTVLPAFPALTSLSLAAVPGLDDSLFHESATIPDLPPLRSLKIEAAPAITSHGLSQYTERQEVAGMLSKLSLKETGLSVDSIHAFLARAATLKFLSVTQAVSKPMSLAIVEPLQSDSLQFLHFEIKNSSVSPRLDRRVPSITEGYYRYLAFSIHAGSLCSLRKLYVGDSSFASMLTSEGVTRLPFSSPSLRPMLSPRTRVLAAIELYTKGPDDSDWFFSEVDARRGPDQQAIPTRNGRCRIQGRPVSAFIATEGSGIEWAGQVRKSVIMMNGSGGFRSVSGAPQDENPVAPMPVLAKALVDKSTNSFLPGSFDH